MMSNMTCPPGNSTTDCLDPASFSYYVGLPLFFIVLGVVIALIYTQRSKLRSMWQLDQLKRTEVNTRQLEGSQYPTMVRPPPADHSPIYENFTDSNNMNRSPSEPEDVYLQCDSPDDAIYGNDLSCSLDILPPDTEEEDLYIMPDAL
ncbi:hypothetical protein J4Q44_G00268220 [Coregonus suidteri]|uniref:Uncharacterized protein n=1 Tax=Coregonus suidteri TaxID=861788 RepID=A0AAN8QUN8_9TELE